MTRLMYIQVRNWVLWVTSWHRLLAGVSHTSTLVRHERCPKSSKKKKSCFFFPSILFYIIMRKGTFETASSFKDAIDVFARSGRGWGHLDVGHACVVEEFAGGGERSLSSLYNTDWKQISSWSFIGANTRRVWENKWGWGLRKFETRNEQGNHNGDDGVKKKPETVNKLR